MSKKELKNVSVPLQETLGKMLVKGRIRELGRKKGYSMDDIAENVNLSRSQLDKINLLISSTTPSKLMEISNFIGVSYYELLEVPDDFFKLSDKEGNFQGVVSKKYFKNE